MSKFKTDVSHAAFALLPQADKDEYLRALAEQPDTVTGHYIMDDGSYGGPYTFPNNKDKLAIHWPNNVVPDAPAGTKAADEEFYREDGEWKVRPSTRPTGDNSTVPNPLYDASVAARTEEERLRFLPYPTEAPQRNAAGIWPITVLNADRTAWVWQYPEQGENL
jgi:hypothetical protein